MTRRFAKYARVLKIDAETRAGELSGRPIVSVYFGGGTPTLMDPKDLVGVLDAVRELYDVAEDAEITIEANPETVETESLAELRRAGFDRISLGFQSLDPEILSFLGRGHTAEEAVSSFRKARSAGFERISVDLIFGVPGQSPASWALTLAQAVALGPEHISAYDLTIHTETVFTEWIDKGLMEPPDEDLAADMFEFAMDYLAEEGYEHYEISNYAKPGERSRHNLLYWNQQDYLGLGAGAHSRIDDEWTYNPSSINDYFADDYHDYRQEISDAERLSEFFFVGLRKMEGVDLGKVVEKHGETGLEKYRETIERLIADGLLVRNGDNLRLTRRGILMGNEVFSKFV